MSILKLPLTLCDELMKQVRAFWWGAENDRWKMQWIPWEKLVLLKAFGGMGVQGPPADESGNAGSPRMETTSFPR
jgi:hypothetical protein